MYLAEYAPSLKGYVRTTTSDFKLEKVKRRKWVEFNTSEGFHTAQHNFQRLSGDYQSNEGQIGKANVADNRRMVMCYDYPGNDCHHVQSSSGGKLRTVAIALAEPAH